ncbi:hypothetical protein LINPERHAP1_LOCUS20854 [Linum perenne]
MVFSSRYRPLLLLIIIMFFSLLLHDVHAKDVGEGMGRKMMIQTTEGKAAAFHHHLDHQYLMRRNRSPSPDQLHHPAVTKSDSRMVGFSADYHLPTPHPPKHN